MVQVAKLRSGPVTLYDGGGWFLLFLIAGPLAAVGVLLDFAWNYLVFFGTVRLTGIGLPPKRKNWYAVSATAIGLGVDILYYGLTWGPHYVGNSRVPTLFVRPYPNPLLQLATILIPMAAIAVANFGISRFYFSFSPRQALTLGMTMGILTAPWLIVLLVLRLNAG